MHLLVPAQMQRRCIYCQVLVSAKRNGGSWQTAGTVAVQLAVMVDGSTWAEHSRWSKESNKEAALLFAHLVPPASGAAAHAAPQQHQQPASYHDRLRQHLKATGVKGVKESGSDSDGEGGSDREKFRWALPAVPVGLVTARQPASAS